MDRALMIVGTGLFGLGLAMGCGGGDSDGGGDVSTGIAPSKLLADVTPSEAAQACQRFETGFTSVITEDLLVRALCTLIGAASADTAADCTTQRDTCLDQANQQGSEIMMGLEMEEISLECGDGASLTACGGTVGQLETCFNDTLDLLASVLRDISCDDAASFSMDDLDTFAEDTFQTAPSCESVDCGEGEGLPFGGEDESAQSE